MRLLQGIATLVTGHLRARVGRSCYLVFTIVVAAAALIGLSALVPERAPAGIAMPSVWVANARAGLLPLRYATQIAGMPEVAAVSYLNYLPLSCNTGTVTLNGFAGSGTQAMLERDYAADKVDLAEWNADPMGILVGTKIAQQCGWTRGMHPSPRDGMSGREIEIHIVGTLRASTDTPFADHIAVAHYEYLDRLADETQRGQVAGIIAMARDSGRAGILAARIDERFAHADPPTETQQSGDAENGLQRFGRIELALGWVMAATFACSALVLVSLMAHAAVERRATFAVLRVLGFRRRFLLMAFAVEFTVLTALGITLGFLAGRMFIAITAPLLESIVGDVAAPNWILHALPAAFAAALIAGLLMPAAVLVRTRAIDYHVG